MSNGGFAARLHALRTGVGLSQEELAQAAGVSVRALSDLERGRSRGPQRRTVQALATALGLDGPAAAELEHTASLGRPRPRPRPRPRSEAGPATQPETQPVPHHPLQLPRDLGDFTARGSALNRLRALAEHLDPAHPPVAAVSGQPGLGKTAFAVHAAHTLTPHFPHGQYAIYLRGMDPHPTPPRDALARLLRALGTADNATPTTTEDRSGLLRSLLRDRRILLLLDNAADENQVRPLLPGHSPSLTLITSRNTLAGLEAVHRPELTLLRREEAVELLTRVIGPERVRRESQAARDLADLCGHLPLAVRIAAQRLAAQPGEHLSKLATQLAESTTRLDTLQAGSLQVRAAFALSYRQLPPPTRTVFRRAALAAGPDFSPQSAALLAGLPLRQAAKCAQDLTNAGLLQPHPTADRYRFHDLLRLFAAEQLAEEDEPAHTTSAQNRADLWTLHRATAAAQLFDTAPHPDTSPTPDPDPATAPADHEQARVWLEAEKAQWLAALGRAQARGLHQQVIDTAEAMHWFSDRTPHWEAWAQVFQWAVDSARALGSKRDEAVHLNYLAWAYNMCLYDHTAALATAQAALAAARESGDQLQIGWALGYAAGALHRLGRTNESITWLQEAADHLGKQTGPESRLAELTALNSLGQQLRQTGRAQEALAIHRRSEAICHTGVPGKPQELIGLYLAVTRQHIGNDLAALNRWNEAEHLLRYVLTHFQAAQMPAWSEPARLDLGIVLLHLNRHHEAHTVLTTAHDALVRLNNPRKSEAADHLHQLHLTCDVAPDSTG
ncbi:helix-turn-helix domain-containing protein [Streptomyces sp. NBC_01443]|uniref:helix-turn-helix domain-containing protein n=1 Tax=Streptomyces sp. NBC_01443 TaxID=2903868 RepID=UPI0022514750|nr:helix-turn-helix domain-containing protein [Streptomyces sp. NBC_01443]MCX4632297.1 helix-turn-helix domain-containing protein [Streptomyces sp. NBC_01443]